MFRDISDTDPLAYLEVAVGIYSTQAIFHLKQAMGGGKTHLLVGFGLLAKHPELRKMYCAG